MESIGLLELQILFLVAPCAIILFCVWKFYQILSRVNDNIAGIRHAVERSSPERPTNA